jgi:hypothetical protein
VYPSEKIGELAHRLPWHCSVTKDNAFAPPEPRQAIPPSQPPARGQMATAV